MLCDAVRCKSTPSSPQARDTAAAMRMLVRHDSKPNAAAALMGMTAKVAAGELRRWSGLELRLVFEYMPMEKRVQVFEFLEPSGKKNLLNHTQTNYEFMRALCAAPYMQSFQDGMIEDMTAEEFDRMKTKHTQ